MRFMKPVMAIAAVCAGMLATMMMTGLARSKKAKQKTMRHGMMRRGHSR